MRLVSENSFISSQDRSGPTFLLLCGTAVEQNEYEAARKALERARTLGLPEAHYEELSDRIGRSEGQARVSALLATRVEHVVEVQYSLALGCYREVPALEPERADAQEMTAHLEVEVAWEAALEQNTEEGYFGV